MTRVVSESGTDLGVAVVEGLPVLGMTQWTAAGPIMAIAADLDHEERRFTIAHELAHLVFDLPRPPMPATHEEREERADRFARELLALLDGDA